MWFVAILIGKNLCIETFYYVLDIFKIKKFKILMWEAARDLVKDVRVFSDFREIFEENC